ncbi:MAG: ATP-binding cassette domain-containing protein [Myxococcales bacterium]|nr:MAG: ATP-binding cassette domain-containing protein [Myxococcales bacterium]
MSSAELAIQVKDLEKSYGSQSILKGLSFDVLRGQTNMVIGQSGSGKSVLMRQVIRLEEPDKGSIVLDGTDIAHLSEHALMKHRHKFGMVFQMSALFDSMSVFDNVAFPLREHKKELGKKEIHTMVMHSLEELNIANAANKLPAEISGGMAKRAAIARALIMKPEILIYDEPTSGLDPIASRKVDDLVLEMQDRFKITSLVISHDIESVLRIADRVNVLHHGTIEISGSPQDLLESKHEVVRTYLEAAGIKGTTAT